jgi:hypothetical protein
MNYFNRHRWNPLKFDPNQGTWGLNVIPESAKAAWGARAILTERGADLLPDRQSLIGESEEKERLKNVLNGSPPGTGVLNSMQQEIRRLVKADLLCITPRYGYDEPRDYKDKPDEFVLADENGVVVIGNTQGSCGYIYLAAFFKSPDFKLSFICENCPNEIDLNADICSGCNRRLCPDCFEYECPYCDRTSCKQCSEIFRCANNRWSVPEPCGHYICPDEECLEESPECEICESKLCEDCSEKGICYECSAELCAGCGKNLYRIKWGHWDTDIAQCDYCEANLHFDCEGECKRCVEEDEEYDED